MAEATQALIPTRRKTVTADRVRELLNYDPETGMFSWTVLGRAEGTPRFRKQERVGAPATPGHLQVWLDGRLYQLHRIAWLYVHGQWPRGQIDHINLCKTDNRIANLREASPSQNCANKVAHKDNPTGTKGMWERSPGRFRAKITKDYRQISLGTFGTIEEAAAAYAAKAKELFGEFARIE